MKNNDRMISALVLALLTAASAFAATAASETANVEEAALNEATPAPRRSQTLPLLNFQIEKNTDSVHLINTNNDPYVYTKVYKLKYADPYEIRPYIMAAVRSRRVTANSTKVEAIRYADGTGMLIVSAEDYRFEPLEGGMTVDALVASLDKPGLSSERGRKFFVYYAKYYDGESLRKLISEVGIQKAYDLTELEGGIDTVRADQGLNALMFYCSPASEKSIRKMLADYDGPTTEAEIKYTIYEMYSENDGNLGVDFQAWKNGMGSDLFAAGASYLSGLPINSADVVKDAHANFINFNPRWNSKFLDFLVAKSKAGVVTSGTMSIMNKSTGSVASVTRFPVIGDGEVEVEGTPATVNVTKYADGNTTITKEAATEATTEKTFKIRKTRNSEFGFYLDLTPEVNGKASLVNVNMSNTSLLGFQNDGTPRTGKSDFATSLMVGNDEKTFYIGGLVRYELSRSVNKVPFLGDIPGLGFLFSGESERLKKSRLVAVLTVRPVTPATALSETRRKEAEEARKKVEGFGIKKRYLKENEYGFDQYLLDKDKK